MLDWVPGDLSGLQVPAHSVALRAGGESFLTEAFHSSGALAADNRVAAITQFEEWAGGSTGRKLLLSVAYDRPAPGLHTELFVKFSRDFEDPIRDRAKRQMQSEVRFASMSRLAGFPIAVPACLFADYHQESGTGILVTQRIAFGTGAIERHYDKCLDYEMPQPLEHYRALLRTVASASESWYALIKTIFVRGAVSRIRIAPSTPLSVGRLMSSRTKSALTPRPS